ncbi:MAG: hypothetical protein ABI461_24100, partial [Polyangiaceae bacterium]
MAHALERASHTVMFGACAKSAPLAVRDNTPDAVIVGYQGKSQLDAVREICVAHPVCHVIATIDSGTEVAGLLTAGAQEIIRRPILADELLARVQAPERWLQRTSELDIRSLASWATLKGAIATDLGQTIGCPLNVRATTPDAKTWPVRGGSIAMSLARYRVELRVSIVADDAAMAWLAGTLLGDPKANAESSNDMLRELANVAGAAVKRSIAADGYVLTTGVPINDVPTLPDAKTCLIASHAKHGFLGWVVEIKSRRNQRISASKLAEGMVLVRDLRNESGALLAAAGTRLTSSTAERV